MSVKINKLEIENVKRIKAVKLEPTANGLTVIGGRNNQGKTSVLDSPSALIRQQQDILAQNGENQRKREQAGKIREETKRAYDEVKRLSEQLEAAKQHHLQLVKDLETAEKSAADLVDQSTKELEDSISNIEEINTVVSMINFQRKLLLSGKRKQTCFLLQSCLFQICL